MLNEKKAPVIVDGMPLYTLTSYEPVTVTVAKREIGDGQIDNAVTACIVREGGGLLSMLDKNWIHEHFPEVYSVEELREKCRKELVAANEDITEQRRIKECANALAARLEQYVLKNEIRMVRLRMEEAFTDAMVGNNWTIDQYYEICGKTKEDVEEWFDVVSVATAEQMAALSAFARERGLVATSEEVLDSIQIAPNGPQISKEQIVHELKMQGKYEEARSSASNHKALEVLLREANCTYDYEKGFEKFDPIHGFPTIRFF